MQFFDQLRKVGLAGNDGESSPVFFLQSHTARVERGGVGRRVRWVGRKGEREYEDDWERVRE